MGERRLVVSKCHGCDVRFEGIKFMSYTRGRPVIFHNQQCLAQYLKKNRVNIPQDLQITVDIYQRLISRAEELKTEVLFNSPNSHQTLVDEAVLFEFSFLLSGKPTVTIQDRLPPTQIKQ
jgi:hypothetical protein